MPSSFQVPLLVGTRRPGSQPPPDRDPGEDLVPEQAQQVEEAAGGRTGGGQHGARRPASSARAHPVPRVGGIPRQAPVRAEPEHAPRSGGGQGGGRQRRRADRLPRVALLPPPGGGGGGSAQPAVQSGQQADHVGTGLRMDGRWCRNVVRVARWRFGVGFSVGDDGYVMESCVVWLQVAIILLKSLFYHE